VCALAPVEFAPIRTADVASLPELGVVARAQGTPALLIVVGRAQARASFD